jgi:2-polyprenyl-6-methoxyphenol hydroxylase-like FAD-dependent oxidoreductase
MKAVVIGGGIAGLASALALTRRGWQVEVFERAPEFTEIGAGLSLWPNALRALDALGVGEVVRGRAVLQGAVGIRDPAGRWLSRTDTADLERRFGLTAMIHRADLLAVLRAAVPEGVLRPGTLVREVRADGTVTHSGGECRADLVVGADGVNSATRQSVWPDSPAPRYAGYTSWRMVCPPVPVTEVSECWGRGERFGYAPLPDGRIYVYATANAQEGAGDGRLASPDSGAAGRGGGRLGAPSRPVRAACADDLHVRGRGAGGGRCPRHDPEPRAGSLPGPRGRCRARQRDGQRRRAQRL